MGAKERAIDRLIERVLQVRANKSLTSIESRPLRFGASFDSYEILEQIVRNHLTRPENRLRQHMCLSIWSHTTAVIYLTTLNKMKRTKSAF